MNLRAFHIVFIVLSTLLAFGFGVWCLGFRPQGANGVYLGMGIVSFVVGLGLAAYGTWFLKKAKGLGGSLWE